MSNVTATTGQINYATEVRVRKHKVMFDEPEGSGGGWLRSPSGLAVTLALKAGVTIHTRLG